MDNINTFLTKYTDIFIKYTNVYSIKKTNICNWLYIFDVSRYNEDLSVELPQNSFKFGKTNKQLVSRLTTYDSNINMRNIECFHCTLPDKREILLKYYLRRKSNIQPTCGQEYYTGCKEYVKTMMLIVLSLSDEDIMAFINLYDLNVAENLVYLDRLHNIYESILNTGEYTLDVIPVSDISISHDVPNSNFSCEVCRKKFITERKLNNHQKSSKKCALIRQTEYNNDNFNRLVQQLIPYTNENIANQIDKMDIHNNLLDTYRNNSILSIFIQEFSKHISVFVFYTNNNTEELIIKDINNNYYRKNSKKFIEHIILSTSKKLIEYVSNTSSSISDAFLEDKLNNESFELNYYVSRKLIRQLDSSISNKGLIDLLVTSICQRCPHIVIQPSPTLN